MQLTEGKPEPSQRRAVIAGGRGLIGRHLAHGLRSAGFDVTVLTRRPVEPGRRVDGIRMHTWNPHTLTGWTDRLDGADVVVNLCGESIAGPRWTTARKAKLLASRVVPTQALVRASDRCRQPPAMFLQASGVGFVGIGDDDADETSAPGSDYLAQLAQAWESCVSELGAACAILRFGVVLAPDGGAFPQMAIPFRMFCGGPIATGQQWLSWVHIDDVVGAALHVVATGMSGPIHVTAPEPVRNADFANVLAKALGRPCRVRLPRAAMELLIGEQATLLCDGQRALPRRLQETGYEYHYPTISRAVQSLIEPGARHDRHH